jgi:hypothetical protein
MLKKLMQLLTPYKERTSMKYIFRMHRNV